MCVCISVVCANVCVQVLLVRAESAEMQGTEVFICYALGVCVQ